GLGRLGNARPESDWRSTWKNGRNLDLQRLLLREFVLSLSVRPVRLRRIFRRRRRVSSPWRPSLRHHRRSVLRSIFLFLHSAAGRLSVEDGDLRERTRGFHPGHDAAALLSATW